MKGVVRKFAPCSQSGQAVLPSLSRSHVNVSHLVVERLLGARLCLEQSLEETPMQAPG